jgi:predicted O-methyltransferase YrrM
MGKFTSYDLCGDDPNPMTRGEVDFLKNLVTELPARPIIINIGAERGTSTLAMLEQRNDAFIFSIDKAPCEQEMENLNRAELPVRKVVRLLGASQTIGTFWPFAVDMVFVDGDHSENGVRGDIIAWRDKIKKGGILAFHDYIMEPIPKHIKGRVMYAVDDLMEGYRQIGRITHRLIAFRIE